MDIPHEQLPLDLMLERIRTHRWWKGKARVVAILANWQEGHAYSAAVFQTPGFSLVPHALQATECVGAKTARAAALGLLQRLDGMLESRIAELRAQRDRELTRLNTAIAELTGAPEPSGATT